MARGEREGGAAGGLADVLTPRRIGVIVLVAAFAIWCSVNSKSVSVSFLVTSTDLPLFVALLLAGLLGVAAGFLVARRGRDD